MSFYHKLYTTCAFMQFLHAGYFINKVVNLLAIGSADAAIFR